MSNFIKFLSKLNSYCCINFAESWDNVGLLVNAGFNKTISNILVTNDLTEAVFEEALQFKADLIITYHPLIFKGIKSVDTSYWKNKIAAKCLENSIAVYSPHTGLDNKINGVNDWILSPFQIVKSIPLSKNKSSEIFYQYYVHVNERDCLPDELYMSESFNWKILDNFIYEVKVPSKLRDSFEKLLPGNIESFSSEINYEQCPGSGRLVILKETHRLSDCIEKVKKVFSTDSVRVTFGNGVTEKSPIKKIGVCAGSGGSFISNDNAKKVDLFITGEASHHELLDFKHLGISVITAGHTTSERGYLKNVFTTWLKENFDELNIKYSENDREAFVNI